MPSPAVMALLFVVGALASAVNSVAGGGSLISFPTLIGLGVPQLPANATNSVALWPGSLAGAIGFLNQLGPVKQHLRSLFLPTLLGSIAGAFLLVLTPESAFRVVVPILIFLATLLLAFQPRIKKWASSRHHRLAVGWGMALQLLVAIYGGYFGAGMGIMMLAVFGLIMEGSIHEMNAVKTWLSLLINIAASTMFLIKGLVLPWHAVALTAGSILGGYFAARWSQKVDSEILRKGIVVLGFAMTAWFTYGVLK
ncbi:MAG: sulfite exporter TauE/SafE family protein [Fimbriimonadaceae bacterium]|nr:sulfite exporter TauE/SafE family protein [Fimbriimonadaceae bacterium]